MPALLNQNLKESRPAPRIFLWTLLGIFNAVLWLMLLAFHWEISLRAREVYYFGTHLFPVQAPRGVPLYVIYAACALLTLASAGAILRDRRNLATRERIRTLLFQILDSLDIGVVVLDDQDLLSMANESARRLLPEIPHGTVSTDILEVLQNHPGLQQAVAAATKSADYVQEIEQDIGTPEAAWPVRITTLPLRDPQKHKTGTLLLIHDVRDRVRMERQMRIAERLSALGTLAAAMAHEIRNPLEAMDLNLALLNRTMKNLPDEAHDGNNSAKYARILESEISRLAGIVENFLAFARPDKSLRAEIRLDSILRQIVDLLTNQAQSRRIALELTVDGHPVVTGSEDQLKQAFLNLVINGMEAMPSGGSLRIRLQTQLETSSIGSGNLAVVCIQDTGVGIPREQMSQLFDPYFTTRPHGTGLGLTIVHRVVQEHNGRIQVASVPGEGSTFTVALPLSAVGDGDMETAAHV